MTESGKVVGMEKWKIGEGGSRRCCCKVCIGITIFMVILSITMLILYFTLFQSKQPETDLLSVTVDGVSPKVLGLPPMVKLELNLTLDIKVLVHNPNHVGFNHGPGQCLMLYRGTQVAQADILPGNIPAMGSSPLDLKLTLEMDQLASEMSQFITDIMDGQIAMDTSTWIAGRINIFGIKKHVAATSLCHIVVAMPTMKVESQDCKNHASL